MKATNETNWIEAVGAPAAAAIREMVAALECDYERLEELKSERSWDEARERINEDPLSIEVRSNWHTLGTEDVADCEFCILLTTGGPAVRIIGEIENGQAIRPRLEVQDWGTPWTEYLDIDRDVLLSYCSCFYFGD